MPVPGDGLWLIYSIVTILFPAILAFFATRVGNGVGLGHGDLNGNMQGERAGNMPLKRV